MCLVFCLVSHFGELIGVVSPWLLGSVIESYNYVADLSVDLIPISARITGGPRGAGTLSSKKPPPLRCREKVVLKGA